MKMVDDQRTIDQICVGDHVYDVTVSSRIRFGKTPVFVSANREHYAKSSKAIPLSVPDEVRTIIQRTYPSSHYIVLFEYDSLSSRRVA